MSSGSNLVLSRTIICSESILRMWNMLQMANSEPIESTGSVRYVGRLGSYPMGIRILVVMGEITVMW